MPKPREPRDPYVHGPRTRPAPSQRPQKHEYVRCLLCGASRLPEKFDPRDPDTGARTPYGSAVRYKIIGGYKHIRWTPWMHAARTSEEAQRVVEDALDRLIESVGGAGERDDL